MKQSKVSTTYNNLEVKGRKHWRVFMLLKPVYSLPNKQLNGGVRQRGKQTRTGSMAVNHAVRASLYRQGLITQFHPT